MDSKPLIESCDSEEENNDAQQKRKQPPVESTNDKKRRRVNDIDPGPFGNPNCFNCSDSGHLARDCTKPRPYEQQGCLTCSSRAHSSKFCPKRIEALEQDRATLLQMQAYGTLPGYSNYNHLQDNYNTDPYYLVGDQSLQCFKCGKNGHKERDCLVASSHRLDSNIKCYNCLGKGHFAKDCTKESKPQSCYNCGETGHLGKDCTRQGRVCFICKVTGHLSRQCPNGHSQIRTCYNCGEEGHIGKDCSKPFDVAHVCFSCKQPGHKAIDCTSQKHISSHQSNYSSYSNGRRNYRDY